MSTRRTRRPSIAATESQVYDPERHGMVDQRTGAFTPNVDARAPLSKVDQDAAARGTHASPASTEFQKAFPNSALNRVVTGVDNPPPMNNDRGQAAAASLPQTRQVRVVAPAPVTSPNGNAQTDAANLAQNQAMYRAGGMTTPVAGAAPAVANGAVTTRSGPKTLDLKSNAVQGMLDKVIGYEGHTDNQTPTNVASNYGTGSVRFARGAGMDIPPASPIVENGVQTGVGRAAFDPVAARTALKRAYPDVYKAGTPENQAFVAHAKEFGEQSAHENLDKIMAPVLAARGAAAPAESASQVRGDINTPGSSADQIASAATNKATGGAGAIFKPDSVLGRVANFISPTQPTSPATPKPGILSRIGSAIGITDAGQDAIGATARAAGAAAKSIAAPLANMVPGTSNPAPVYDPSKNNGY